jgi:hypothetical protein
LNLNLIELILMKTVAGTNHKSAPEDVQPILRGIYRCFKLKMSETIFNHNALDLAGFLLLKYQHNQLIYYLGVRGEQLDSYNVDIVEIIDHLDFTVETVNVSPIHHGVEHVNLLRNAQQNQLVTKNHSLSYEISGLLKEL